MKSGLKFISFTLAVLILSVTLFFFQPNATNAAVLFNDDLPLDELRTQVQQLWTLWFGNPRRP